MPDGGYGLAIKGSPDYPAAELYEQQQKLKSAGVLEGDLLKKAGGIFGPKEKGLATIQANKANKTAPGHTVVPVTGGYVVRQGVASVQDSTPRVEAKTETPTSQAPEAGAPDEAGTTAAGAEGGSAGVEATGVAPVVRVVRREAEIDAKTNEVMAVIDQMGGGPSRELTRRMIVEKGFSVADKSIESLKLEVAKRQKQLTKYETAKEKTAVDTARVAKPNALSPESIYQRSLQKIQARYENDADTVTRAADTKKAKAIFEAATGKQKAAAAEVKQESVAPQIIAKPTTESPTNAQTDQAVQVKPPETSSQTSVAAVDIKAATVKLVPDMSDVELTALQDYYGPDHKRTPKLAKEIEKRASNQPVDQSIRVQADPENVAPDFTKDLADARAGLVDLQTKRKLTRSSKRADIDGQIERVKATIAELETAMDETPAADIRLGRDNVPMHRGGKPYKTNRDAKKAKALQPVMRVVRVEGGYALAEKTPAQLAAEDRSARNLRNPNTEPANEPIAAHAFIARKGGLAPSERSDMGMEGNVRIGNRFLFASQGNGLSIEQATEYLYEEGYIQEEDQQAARNSIKRSLTNPQYTPEGTERMAEQEAEQRRKDYDAEQEAIADQQALDDNEFADAADAYESAMLDYPASISQSDGSREDAFLAMGFTEQEYQSAIADQSREPQSDSQGPGVTAEVATRPGAQSDSGRVSTPGEDSGSGSQASGLTAPTKADILDQQQRATDGEKANASQRKAEQERLRKTDERKDIAKASEAAADTFELGGNAEQNLSGQGGMFDEPAVQAKPAKPTPSAAELRAKADLNNALADLGDIFSKPFKANLTPEQEQKLLPVLTRVLDAAFRLGYAKFKDAAKFALDQIRGALGAEVADALTLDQLQGSYIAMAGGKPGTDTKRAVIDVETKLEIENHTAKADNQPNEEPNVPSADSSVERDSAEPAAQPAVGDTVPADTGAAPSAIGQDGGPASRGTRGGQQDGAGVPFGSAPVAGDRGDQPVPAGNQPSELEGVTAGSDFSERGGDSGIEGIPLESIAASEVVAVADKGNAGLKASVERVRADKVAVIPANLDNIRTTLPQLLPGQDTDVLAAEQRFAKPDGYGMLFTNGTGTGKTFVGLGITKRFEQQGKSNTLIVVPDDKIASDWMQSGRVLGLNITALTSTKDAGTGIVITSYANLGDNDQLATRNWDLVVADEAHTLMQSAEGDETSYLRNMRAITLHPDGAGTRHSVLNHSDIDAASSLRSEIAANDAAANAEGVNVIAKAALAKTNARLAEQLSKLDAKLSLSKIAIRQQVKDSQGAARPRLAALSATPFAYEKTIDWANGYLFDYKDGYPFDENRAGLNYNQPSPREYYFQTRFGYTMRTNKLNKPGADVDAGLLQRMWNGEMKKSGALSGRLLDVAPDYDRRFVLVQSAIGNRIDEALAYLNEQRQNATKDDSGFSNLAGVINKQFEYLQKRYLLEAIKATEVVPIVKAHMAMGRKVVVFHDYKKGGGFNPFKITRSAVSADGSTAKSVAQFNAALTEFNQKFADLVNYPFESMGSPIEVFSRELPGVLLINGDEKKADLLKRYKQMQDDTTGPLVMLVQSAKNKGWSGHDTTGKNQRVLINLGQPTAPTLAIQQEGRIYRTGQKSDAIMRYLNTGTNWERWTFASTIATRASTAENLGMGEAARALKDSFIQSFEESDTYAPGHEGEGKGGKERDKAANNALTEFDRAKALYAANQKKTARTKAQEGVDYFATPEPVGLKMVEWLDARAGEDLLEPSGGHGAIARWFPEKASKTVIEPSLALRSRLALAMNATEDRIIDGTFEDHATVNKYDGIAMNPPFGTAGKTAVDHIAKAALHLRDGGRIVALIPTGPAADKKFEKWFYERNRGSGLLIMYLPCQCIARVRLQRFYYMHWRPTLAIQSLVYLAAAAQA